VCGDRLRVITAIVASPGLKTLGKRFSQLTIYSACIDAELDDAFGSCRAWAMPATASFGSQAAPAFKIQALACGSMAVAAAGKPSCGARSAR